MLRLILIRHAETDYSADRRYCGFSDPPLNKKGIWQAQQLAKSLNRVDIDRVYSSDLRRTFQTANIVFKKKHIKKLKSLREINFGVFEGLKHEEIMQRYPKIYEEWINNPEQVKIPNGETFEDLEKRIKKGLSFIISRHKNGNTAVVTHAGPIKIILRDILQLKKDEFWDIKQDTGALNIIDYPEHQAPVVVKMNDIPQTLTMLKLQLELQCSEHL